MTTWARLRLGLCAVLLVAPASSRVGRAQDGSLLSAAIAIDELARARLAQRLGDETILAALAQHEDSLARLAAVRCAPYLRDPLRALGALTELAAGRDPELAPAAAQRALAIAQRLALHELGQEERDTDLAQHPRALRALANATGASRTLRVSAGQAAFLLEQAAAR